MIDRQAFDLSSLNVIIASPVWSLNGPNIFAANLVRGLQAASVRAHVLLTRHDWHDAKPMPCPPDIPMKKLPVQRFASLRSRWRAMTRYLESMAPCIYVPNYDFSHSCISSRLPERVGIVGIVHSDDPQHYEHVARLGRYWDAIVAVSPSVAEQTIALDGSFAPRVTVIPYGVDIPDHAPAPRGDGVLKIIYAGRLMQRQKRIFDLPRIVRAVVNHGIPVELTLVGGGADQVLLAKAFEELAVHMHVRFLGTLSNSDVLDVLARHDVFILTSEFEGLPVGLLEAMGRGCVPVVTDIRSGIPDLVRDGINGFQVPVGDIEEFAARLGTLQCDTARRQEMALSAYHSVSTGGYRTEDMTASYVTLFGRVLEQEQCGAYRRPRGRVRPPPGIPWPEHLPGALQRIGHHGKRLLMGRED